MPSKLKSLKDLDYKSLKPSDFRKSRNTDLNELNLVKEIVSDSLANISIAVVLHIHYPEGLEKASSFILELGEVADYFISTSDEKIYEELLAATRGLLAHLRVVVELVPNVGRNFAPLLVTFSSAVMEHEYLIHWHSKQSPHASVKIRHAWIDALDNTLLNREVLTRAISLMKATSNCALMHPDVVNHFRRLNYKWNLPNRRSARLIFDRLGLREELDPKAYELFPIGGMFLAKVALLRPIFEAQWSISDFDVEDGQVDGTLQHAIERFFGRWCDLNSLNQLIYQPGSNRFYNVRYLKFRGQRNLRK